MSFFGVIYLFYSLLVIHFFTLQTLDFSSNLRKLIRYGKSSGLTEKYSYYCPLLVQDYIRFFPVDYPWLTDRCCLVKSHLELRYDSDINFVLKIFMITLCCFYVYATHFREDESFFTSFIILFQSGKMLQ